MAGRVESGAAERLYPSSAAARFAPDYWRYGRCAMSPNLSAEQVRQLALRLSERDQRVVRCVNTLHFTSGAQLTRLCFEGSDDPRSSARAARRALLRLVRLGLLARLPRPIGGVRAGSAGFVYRLGLAGQRLAILSGWQPQQRWRRSLTPGTLFLRHTLLVAELHTRLIEAERAGRFELLALEAEPVCHRDYDGPDGRGQTLKPDSSVRLGLGEYEDSYFIEVDRGSEGSRALDAQLARYLAYYASGTEQAKRGVFPKTVWLVSRPERAAVVAECIEHLEANAQALFAVAPFEEALDALAGPEPATQQGS